MISPNVGQLSLQQYLECEICLLVFPRKGMFGLNCGHKFCKDCWIQYLINLLGDIQWGKQSLICPASNCGILVDHIVINFLLKISKAPIEIQEKFSKFEMFNFVEVRKEI